MSLDASETVLPVHFNPSERDPNPALCRFVVNQPTDDREGVCQPVPPDVPTPTCLTAVMGTAMSCSDSASNRRDTAEKYRRFSPLTSGFWHLNLRETSEARSAGQLTFCQFEKKPGRRLVQSSEEEDDATPELRLRSVSFEVQSMPANESRNCGCISTGNVHARCGMCQGYHTTRRTQSRVPYVA